jgi:hypothetical protein
MGDGRGGSVGVWECAKGKKCHGLWCFEGVDKGLIISEEITGYLDMAKSLEGKLTKEWAYVCALRLCTVCSVSLA